MEAKDRLKYIRNVMGLSQSGFANYFGIPVATYQGWEQGRRKPPAYVISLLLRLLERKGVEIPEPEPGNHEEGKAQIQEEAMKDVFFIIHYKDEDCATVFRDEAMHYSCECHMDDPMKTPFAGGEVDGRRIEAFLKSRCPDPHRGDLEELLEIYGLDSLDPVEWCRKTHGVTHDDFFWIQFPREDLSWENVKVR